MTTNNTTSNRLPALPGTSTRAKVPCRCGCGGSTQREFVPGHDARLKAIILRVVRGVMTLEDVEAWGGRSIAAATEIALTAREMRAFLERNNLADEVDAFITARNAEADADVEQAG